MLAECVSSGFVLSWQSSFFQFAVTMPINRVKRPIRYVEALTIEPIDSI
jgi:hypothetical protein